VCEPRDAWAVALCAPAVVLGLPATWEGFGAPVFELSLDENGLLFQNARFGMDQLPPLLQPARPTTTRTTRTYRATETRMT
jgi:hypothetical protein